MANDPLTPDDNGLQFDRVEGAQAGTQPAVTCSSCGRALTTEYYVVNGAPVCASCKDAIKAASAEGLRVRRFPKALLFGLLAAIAGAILYYGVIAITDFEIGIVAIACGYMVGWGVRRGAGGTGGRRYQILAAALTYFSVGLAYMPLALKGFSEAKKHAVADSASTRVTAVTDSVPADKLATQSADSIPGTPVLSAADSSPTGQVAAPVKADSATATKPEGPMAVLVGLGAVLLLVWSMPVMAVIGSLPGGLLSALIIGIGMRQAWQMTAASTLIVEGPFAVGGGLASA